MSNTPRRNIDNPEARPLLPKHTYDHIALHRGNVSELVSDLRIDKADATADILHETGKRFVKNGSGSMETNALLEEFPPHEAITLGIMQAMDVSLKELIDEQHPKVTKAMAIFNAMSTHMPGVFRGKGASRIMELTNQGVAVMQGLVDVLPGLYAQKHRKDFSPDALHKLIESKPFTKMVSQLSNMAGKDAISIERILGIHLLERKVGSEIFFVAEFDAHNFVLREHAHASFVDVSDATRKLIDMHRFDRGEKVYGCLAHYATVTIDGKEVSLFSYLHDVITERYIKLCLEK